MAMTNSDFRSLLKIGSSTEVINFNTEKKRKLDSKSTQNDQKREKRKNHYLQIQKKKNEKEKKLEEDQDTSGYRDRAEERRLCKEDFYKQVAEEYHEMNDRSIEESKYLGGDTEHTHLVKGLDYALLSKVRSELEESKKDAEIKSMKIKNENKKKEFMSINTATGKRVHKLLFQDLHPHHLSFQDKLKHIDSVILKGLKFKGNSDIFLPGRTCYLFDTRMEMIGEDIPTIIFHSREDCPPPNEGLIYCSNPQITKIMTEALKWHTMNKKKRKQDRLPRRPGSNPARSNHSETSNLPENTKKQNENFNIDDDNIYTGIDSFDPNEFIEYSSSHILNNENLKDVNILGHSTQSDSISHTIKESDASTRNRFDIIRDEQGMEVDDDLPQVSAQPYQTSFHPISAGNDPNSSMASFYNLNSYGALPSRYLNQELSQTVPSNTGTTQYPPLEIGKFQRSGMTTIEQDKGLYSVYKRDEGALRKRGDEDEREKDPAYISDTYMECYPGFGADISYEAYESDDDEDRSKMDMGRLKQFGAKRREDFARKEDWERYQLEKEALPKAAFQYGRKMDDNRVTRRKKKLNADEEWKKIEKMINEKEKKV